MFFPYGAIFWKILGCFCFAGINVTIKTIGLPSCQIACLESLCAALFLSVIFFKYSFPKSLLGYPSLWLRPLLGLGAVLMWIYSLKGAPIGHSVAIGLLVPFLSALAATFFLGERLSMARLGALFMALIGGFFILYGSDLFQLENFKSYGPLLFAPLLAKFSFSSIDLLTKHLIKKTHPLILSFALVFPMGISLLGTYGSWQKMDGHHVIKVMVLGTLTALAHISMHMAYKKTDYTFLLPLGPVRVVASCLLAWFFLNEKLPPTLMTGTCLIIFALMWLYTTQDHRRHAPLS